MRSLLCEECGVIKPTPPEDAARDLFPRRTTGVSKSEYRCDYCCAYIHKGDKAVCLSIPRDMRYWENEYISPMCGACGCPIDEYGCGCNPPNA